MDFTMKFLLVLIVFYLKYVYCEDNYTVQIYNNKIINTVSDKFISFTIDPKLLLVDDDKSDDCLCMAQNLSPAYIRIAGPSTNSISFDDSNIIPTILDKKLSSSGPVIKYGDGEDETMSLETWNIFLQWMKTSDLTPFIALNDGGKYFGTSWYPKMAMMALSLADKSKMGECIWQLGYECKQKTADKYLNDLKTLKLIMDAFAPGRNGDWKLASADISQCLGSEQSQKLKSFLLGSSFLDATILKSNGTDDMLDILSNQDKSLVKEELNKKNTLLWKEVKIDQSLSESDEAIVWLNTLGETAKAGYSVVFKDLHKDDLYSPKFSYYVSLLHKRLVGQKVLDIVELNDSDNISIFGHCTALPAPGAVTLFATNSGNERSTVTINLTVKESEGEIVQYLLYQNENGTIIINGKEMTDEGDVHPAVEKVGPFRKLHIVLPPKSVGFWIISNANVQACYDNNDAIFNKILKLKKSKNFETDVMEESLDEIQRKRRSADEEQNELNDVENINEDILKPENISTDFNNSMDHTGELDLEEFLNNLNLENSTDDVQLYIMGSENANISSLKDLLYLMGDLLTVMELEKDLFSEIEIELIKSNSTNFMLYNSTMNNNTSSSDVNDIPEDDSGDKENEEISRFVRHVGPPPEMEEEEEEEEIEAEEIANKSEEVKSCDEGKEKQDKKLFEIKKLPKLTLPKISLPQPKQNIDKLVGDAKHLFKDLTPVIDSVRSESQVEPVMRSAHDIMTGVRELRLKTELEKNRLKIEHLRHKMRQKLNEMYLKTKFRRNRNELELEGDLHSLTKRAIELSSQEAIDTKKYNDSEKNLVKVEMSKNKKMKYFNPIEKNLIHKIKGRKFVDFELNGAKNLRKKRYISIDNKLGSDNMNSITEELRKGKNNKKNSYGDGSIVESLNTIPDFDFDNSKKSFEKEMIENDKHDHISNAIVKMNASKILESHEDVPVTELENLASVLKEKISMDDVLENIGLKKKTGMDQFFQDTTSFFQNLQQKISDFWNNFKQ